MRRRSLTEDLFQKYWWVFFVHGLFSLFIGVSALLFWWIIDFGLVKTFLGLVAFIGGVFLIIIFFAIRRQAKRFWLLLQGITLVWIGVFTLYLPSMTVEILVLSIGILIILAGVFQLYTLMRLDIPLREHPLLVLSFLIYLSLGIFLIINRGSELVNDVWVIGVVVTFQGIVMLILGLKLRLKSI